MTIPYNATPSSMKKYVIFNLYNVEYKNSKLSWYSATENGNKPHINNKDITLLISCIHHILHNNKKKIKRLTNYLKNIAIKLNLNYHYMIFILLLIRFIIFAYVTY